MFGRGSAPLDVRAVLARKAHDEPIARNFPSVSIHHQIQKVTTSAASNRTDPDIPNESCATTMATDYYRPTITVVKPALNPVQAVPSAIANGQENKPLASTTFGVALAPAVRRPRKELGDDDEDEARHPAKRHVVERESAVPTDITTIHCSNSLHVNPTKKSIKKPAGTISSHIKIRFSASRVRGLSHSTRPQPLPKETDRPIMCETVNGTSRPIKICKHRETEKATKTSVQASQPMAPAHPPTKPAANDSEISDSTDSMIISPAVNQVNQLARNARVQMDYIALRSPIPHRLQRPEIELMEQSPCKAEAQKADVGLSETVASNLEKEASFASLSSPVPSTGYSLESESDYEVEEEVSTEYLAAYENGLLPNGRPCPSSRQSTTDADSMSLPADNTVLNSRPQTQSDAGYATNGTSSSIATTASKAIVKASRQLEKKDRKQSSMDEDSVYNDPLYVPDYIDDIMEYLHELEKKYSPDSNYMDRQPQLEWHMRTQLVDWIIEVHYKLDLLPETLHLSINILDRFLAKKMVAMERLQLVGAASLLLASKYEERVAPTFASIVDLAGSAFTIACLKTAERYISSKLGYEFGWPGPLNFLRQLATVDKFDAEIRVMTKYLLEVTLLDKRFLSVPISTVTAGAYRLAGIILSKGSWTSEHVKVSGLKERELNGVSVTLVDNLNTLRRDNLQVFHKYASRDNLRVSLVVDYWAGRHGADILASAGRFILA